MFLERGALQRYYSKPDILEKSTLKTVQQTVLRIMMEEDMSSRISNSRVTATGEVSDSSSTTYPLPAKKRARRVDNVSTKFKGVVPQQNGRWGAQIYSNHQRIWLGTFKSEKKAAMAYDSAAMKLRSADCHKNFPWTNTLVEEQNFQNQYSTEAVLNMIKDGSYRSKFEEFLRTYSLVETENGLNLAKVKSKVLSCEQLFQKELTPSDVGKLNRLVIPKKYAIKHFPRISETNEDIAEGGDVQLTFYDRMMKSWKFRYCYWKSSQSFVFTRGWNKFVKDKYLKANDSINFYLCKCKEAAKGSKSFFMIDINRGENGGSLVEQATQYAGMQLELRLEVSHQLDHDIDKKKPEDEELRESKLTHDTENKGFRLFGVQII